MKRIFQTRLLIFMTLGFLFLLIFVMVVQTVMARKNAESLISGRMQDMKLDYTEWNEIYKTLRDNIDSGAIAKARILARTIQFDPSVLKDNERLLILAKTLNVDSLCVSDREGVLIAASEPGFIGYRMDSTEQSKPFMAAIRDKDFELVQEPQERGIDKVMVQYAGVARLDAPGIVQIGYEADNVFRYSTHLLLLDVIKELPIGKGGRFLVLEDGPDPVVFASGDPHENGRRLSELGFRRSTLFHDFVTIGGVDYFWRQVSLPNESRRILAVIPRAEVYGNRNKVMVFLPLVYLLVFGSLYFLVSHLVRRTVTDGIYDINRTVDRITDGDLTQTVNVKGNPEFVALSDGINTMVSGLKKNMTEFRRRVHRENDLVKSIQATLLPETGVNFPQTPGFDFASGAILAESRGADIVETFKTSDGRPAFLIVEAIGDSVSACLHMMKFRMMLRTALSGSSDPAELLEAVRVQFAGEKLFRRQFLSVFAAVCDVPARRLDYVNAGFYPPFLRIKDKPFVRPDTQPGAVFSASPECSFRKESIAFEPGGMFFACTNGIYTCRDADGVLYSKKMLLDSLNAATETSAQDLVECVRASIIKHTAGLPPEDDVVLTAFRLP